MKKLLTVSVLAIMAVSAANAEIASTGYVDTRTGDVTGTAFDGLSDIEKNLTGAINAIAGRVGTTDVSGQIETASKAITDTIGTGFSSESTVADQLAEVKVTADGAVQDIDTGTDNGTISVDGTDVAVKGLGSAAYTASTAYATAAQGALADSAVQFDDVATTDKAGVVKPGTSVSVAADGTLGVVFGDASGKNTTLPVTGAVVTKAIGDSQSILNNELASINEELVALPTTYAPINTVESAEQTAIDAAEQNAKNYAESQVNALANGAVKANTDAIGTGFSSTSTVADQLAEVKATADGAVQDIDTGTDNGTISVDGTDVAVKGLGSAAYTASTAYATAAQGVKADSAMQLDVLKQDASWTTAGCNGSGVICSLVSKGGNLAWEKVAN